MGIAVNSEKRVERFANQLSKGLVFFGGAVLTALAFMTVLSTIGRAFVGLQIGLGPIPGDFELVEAGTAVSVFCFMSWCQLNQGHVTVDIFTNQFGQRANALLILIGNSLIFIVAFVIAWRLWMGFGEQVTWFSQPIRDLIGFGYKPFTNNTTYILGMPFWYSYLLSFIGAFCFALISAFTVWRSLNDLLGRDK
ncbi:MAG: TRAP transporter small permease [Paracoccaceae bacterium]|jgi:TRAP-type C4-dicarboxylate transport system permease small subunit|nr:TRAP transporter small permease [Paracoccaceae bacterium]MDA0319807.1 TRAP transporter small permease [Pseudomonadota bacterium]MDA0850416.1 TRAP transporter small permease [Pseudomonadota bacterium]MDA1293264.1 TRAP transporter small permease [Pseudomonadota bacterium]NCW14277.1 TRAP transporter small permease [Paracoccaceae bacterium]|tara:strand:+ start:952 stop:1533 length:582 start_codon:yes stop_codon:yes gene_type:complete